MRLEIRNIVVYVLLYIVTCGLFGLYWIYTIGSELYELNDMENKAGLDIILSIVTCGIYFIYLQYKWGKMVDSARRRYDLYPRDDAWLFVILSLFSLSIINFCIIQSQINDDFAPLIDTAVTTAVHYAEEDDDRRN
ncbi:MAG: DUF4234 domain-containing protein [Defluviitaleaceae bacterium]|nr:DUF4234 domain-containing protein [Defluviitaleaceae bacterium]